MHSWFLWASAMVGTSMCLWVLDDIWRLFYLKCVSKYHTVAVDRLASIQVRIYDRCSEIEVVCEELSDTVVEVLGPFLD